MPKDALREGLRKRDPDRIYLEPPPYSPEGRVWCAVDVWPLEGDGPSGVEYVRADLVRRELEAPGDTGADAETMWYHWTHGSEDLALACLRVASDDQARRFLAMLATWQHCPRPSDHDRPEPPGEEA